jgi:hypothetical protein
LPIVPSLKNNKNTFRCSILKFLPNIFVIKAFFHPLGLVCKYILRCKKFYRIGPVILLILGHHLLLDITTKIFVLHRQCHHTLCWNHISLGSCVLSAFRFRRKGTSHFYLHAAYTPCHIMTVKPPIPYHTPPAMYFCLKLCGVQCLLLSIVY